MLLELQKDIAELEKEYKGLETFEIEMKLIEFEMIVVKLLNGKKFLVKPPVEELKCDLRSIKDNLYNLKGEELDNSIKKIKDKIDYIIDGQMTAEIGGAGIYFRNMRNAAKKKREENQ
ncbi:hypothetical protein SAMN04488599_1291 [Halanaerobium congolense]|uniref:hypothetical protein n=1 Tax=Halanaerobium congolense TaxID=54121 RepID=UPI00088F0D31|nr:hypothetical protein [Halanaerobium congolense]SDM86337.1 hypothetical protein SAMN04488599_1291 [Halanaerobium congolense]